MTLSERMPDDDGLLYDERYGYLIPIENVRAAVRLLYPNEMTPTAERRFGAACDAWAPASDASQESAPSEAVNHAH